MAPDWSIVEHVCISFGALVASGASIATLVKSNENAKSIREVHVSINSRMDQLLRERAIASHAEGVEQERNRRTEEPPHS
jgi:hypothetical protein